MLLRFLSWVFSGLNGIQAELNNRQRLLNWMLPMKKILILILTLIILLTCGYLYIRYHVLSSKDFKPDTANSKSILDLRPALIAKLQQLVKDGSDGLYNLSISEIRPHITSGGMDMINVKVVPDSLRLLQLKTSYVNPSEVIKISIDSFHIDGIGVGDLLQSNRIDLKTISLTRPVIEMYRLKKLAGNRKKDTTSIYQKLMKQVKRISIDRIQLHHATLVTHNFLQKNQSVKLGDFEIEMENMLIDSNTRQDQKRFLFAEKLQVSGRNLSGRTADNLYLVKCGSINLSTNEDRIRALDISVEPRYNKNEFESKFTARKYMFRVDIPGLTLSGINWWKMLNGKGIIAKEATLDDGTCEVYLDRSLPFRKIKPNNFPQQILMRVPVPFSLSKMRMHHSKLLYTEYNPGMEQTGSVVISNVNGTIVNMTNISTEIRKNRFMMSTSSGSFMNRIPMDVGFHFDLLKYKTGNFTMDLRVGGLDSSILNPITGPLAEFIVRRGSIQKGIVHLQGNNFKATGNGMLLYKDLYLVSLKKSDLQPGKIKQRKLLSFFGNLLLIKNSNPSKRQAPRKEIFDCQRNDHQPFFSLVWKTIFIGVLKSIGLPRNFANKRY
jgi:hypothetical protein